MVLGVVEGLTEFLPISSTGHLVVVDRLLGVSDPAYEIAIQAGAITAIAFLYRERLWGAVRQFGGAATQRTNLIVLLLIAALPAACVGLLFVADIKRLLFHPVVIAISLVAGGVLFLVLEAVLDRRSAAGKPPALDVAEMGPRQALLIGLCQIVALIPGSSRAGVTIAGGLLLGFRRTAAAEFSFLVGLPILYGACFHELLGEWERLTGALLGELLVGAAVSFATAVAIVGPFLRFLQHHSFRAFAWYRIAAGAALGAAIAAGAM